LTYDLTLAAARAMAAVNPRLTFCYVSGLGTDSSEQGRSMWARVKGRTENALLALPIKAACMFGSWILAISTRWVLRNNLGPLTFKELGFATIRGREAI
jgi:hypothetical protein